MSDICKITNTQKQRALSFVKCCVIAWYDMILYKIWFDLIWYDLIWYDMIWYDIYDMIWYDMIWYDIIWYDATRRDETRRDDTIWYDMVRYGAVRYGTVRHGTTRHDTTRHDTTYMIWHVIWYGVVWFDVVWCGVVWCDIWHDMRRHDTTWYYWLKRWLVTFSLPRPSHNWWVAYCQLHHWVRNRNGWWIIRPHWYWDIWLFNHILATPLRSISNHTMTRYGYRSGYIRLFLKRCFTTNTICTRNIDNNIFCVFQISVVVNKFITIIF